MLGGLAHRACDTHKIGVSRTALSLEQGLCNMFEWHMGLRHGWSGVPWFFVQRMKETMMKQTLIFAGSKYILWLSANLTECLK